LAGSEIVLDIYRSMLLAGETPEIKCSGEDMRTVHRVGQLLAYWIGIIFAALVIGFFSLNCAYFSPEVIRIDSLRPLPL
jgi:hypothetical protein